MTDDEILRFFSHPFWPIPPGTFFPPNLLWGPSGSPPNPPRAPPRSRSRRSWVWLRQVGPRKFFAVFGDRCPSTVSLPHLGRTTGVRNSGFLAILRLDFYFTDLIPLPGRQAARWILCGALRPTLHRRLPFQVRIRWRCDFPSSVSTLLSQQSRLPFPQVRALYPVLSPP